MNGSAEVIDAKLIVTLPETRSAIAGPPPLYGICVILVPVCSAKNSPVRCGAPPMPDEAKVGSPGFCRASAIRSFTDFRGDFALTTSTLPTAAVIVTGSKSFSGS